MVGYPAGGVADFIARSCTEGLNASLGAFTSVENKPGAAGNIAMDAVIKAGPDSGVFGAFSNLQVTLNPLVPQLALKNVDPMQELVPVAAMADLILMLCVSTQFGVKTLDQFLAKAKELGPNVKMGLAGIGTPHHMAALLLQKNAGLDMTLVPYKGGPPMIADAAGGHLDAVITTLPVGGPMVQAGKMKALALTGPKRTSSLPNVPTFQELGYKEMDLVGWFGLWAPAKTPRDRIERIAKEVQKALDSPEAVSFLDRLGMEPAYLPPKPFSDFVAEDMVRQKNFLNMIGFVPQ